MSKNENRNANVNNSNVEITPNSATTATPNLSNYKQELAEVAKRIEKYDSIFGSIQSDLFYLVSEQLQIMSDEINKNELYNIKNRIENVSSLLFVIEERLPKNFFDDIENLPYLINQLLTNPENK